jgi:hypothetical protein
MPLATFQQNDRLGEIVIDSPPLNLFSADLLADLRDAQPGQRKVGRCDGRGDDQGHCR